MSAAEQMLEEEVLDNWDTLFNLYWYSQPSEIGTAALQLISLAGVTESGIFIRNKERYIDEPGIIAANGASERP